MGALVLLSEGPDTGLVSHLDNPNLEQRRIDSSWVGLGNRDILSVSGPDRLTWLHSLTTQFLEGLEPGLSTTALVLSPTGHVEDVLRGVDDGATFWAWTEAGRGPALVEWLDSMRFMMRVEVTAHPELTLVWAGPDVTLPDDVVSMASEIAGGRELLLPEGVEVDAPQAGVRAWEALRIAAGVPRLGIDTDERTIPNEIGLYGTHLDKGCYRGQETVARVHTLGRPPRRLTRLTLDGSQGELPETGAEITSEGRRVGVLGSVAVHHEDGPIALCLLRRATDPQATLDVASVAASQEILVDPQVGLHVRPIL